MITQALVTNGAKVYITGRRKEVLESTIKEYNSGPGSLHALPGDISTKEGAIQLSKDLEAKEPKGIHLLVNNAGIARDDNTKFCKLYQTRKIVRRWTNLATATNGQPDMTDANAISQHFLRSEDAQWAETFKTNVTGQYFMAMAMLPLLAKGREVTPGYTSQVVNVSSISGQMKGSSNGQFAYASSKAACTHVSRMLATTFKDCKVRVNTIAPGIFPSEMTTGKSNEKNKSELSTQIGNPAGRGGHDSDMAATILMLAGNGGLFYNEQTMFPDGGSTLAQPTAKA
jgi:NAD(P)-dependent dehydrogenase (short-subunit alcohol dehydrogenase family)